MSKKWLLNHWHNSLEMFTEIGQWCIHSRFFSACERVFTNYIDINGARRHISYSYNHELSAINHIDIKYHQPKYRQGMNAIVAEIPEITYCTVSKCSATFAQAHNESADTRRKVILRASLSLVMHKLHPSKSLWANGFLSEKKKQESLSVKHQHSISQCVIRPLTLNDYSC